MRRFYAPNLVPEAVSVEVTGDEFRHLKKALRLKIGAGVELFNGRGLICCGKILSVEQEYATVGITGFLAPDMNESPIGLVLLQGLGKGAKPEFIIQKATELGAVEVRFFTGARSVPDVKGKRAEARLVRWSRVAVEAAKQCKRAVVPRIGLYSGLLEAIGNVDPAGNSTCGLLFAPDPSGSVPVDHAENISKNSNKTEQLMHPAGQAGTLKKVLSGLKGCKTVLVLIGPEGGLDSNEAEAAKRAGFIPVSLGKRVLRTETAGVTVLSILQYELGDLG